MHPCSVCAVPADPDVLDDVLGVGDPAQHPIRDPEQARTNALEVLESLDYFERRRVSRDMRLSLVRGHHRDR